MKVSVLMILLMLQFSCREKTNNSDNYNRVVLIHMNFSKETIFSLTCDKFGQRSDLDTIYIADNEIDSVKFYGKKFRLDTTRYINVRGKIIFFVDHEKVEYCFDKFGVFNKKGEYFKNQDLFVYIKKRMKE